MPAVKSKFGRILPRLLPSPGGFLVCIALVAALGPGLAPMFGSDGDVGRHIRVGHQILTDREVPATDVLSHTRYQGEWVPKEWLSQVAFAAADGISGLAGAATVAALLFALAVGVTFQTARLLGGSVGVSLGVGMASMLLQVVHLLPRPHLFTTAFAAVLFLLLVQYRRTGRPGWIAGIPLLFILWTNCHGGFPAGLVLLALFCLDAWFTGRGPDITAQVWMLPLAGALALVGTLLSPSGAAVWPHVLGHLGNDYLMAITQEFRSPDFHASWARVLLVAILGTGLILARGGRPMSGLGLAVLLGTLAATLVSVRHITLFATLGLPWLVDGLAAEAADGEAVDERWPLRPIQPLDTRIAAASSHLLPVTAALVVIALANGPWADRARFDRKAFPVVAMAEVGRLQTGPVFNEMEWGGYLLYEYPGIPIFIDGHADFFGEVLVREYRLIREGGPGWQTALDRYGVNWTLTRRTAPLAELLELSRCWQRLFRDDVAVVFRRAAPAAECGSGTPQ